MANMNNDGSVDECDCPNCTVIRLIKECCPHLTGQHQFTLQAKMPSEVHQMVAGPNGRTLLKMKMARGEI